jgi:hypothetical protein
MQLLNKLDLRGLIEMSAAVVMETSAGGMNMSAAYVDEGMICSGFALGHFSFEGHFDTTDAILAKERFALSKEMNVYVAANREGAVILRSDRIDIIGQVYLISHAQIHRLAETV